MKLCDYDCNHCPIIGHENSRMVTFVLNSLLERFGKGVYEIVQSACPNLTCCFDCRIDGFYHVEGCEIAAAAEEKYGKSTAQHNHQHAQPAIYRLAQTYFQEYGMSGDQWDQVWHFAQWADKQRASAQ